MELQLAEKSKKKVASLKETFNRLRRKIDLLSNKLKKMQIDTDQALNAYHSALKPKEKEAGQCITKFVLLLRKNIDDKKKFTKRQRTMLEDIIQNELDLIFALVPHAEVDERIKELYQEINGKSCADDFHEGLNDVQEMLKEFGCGDLDLSNLNPDDSFQEIFQKMAESFFATKDKDECLEKSSPPPSKPKSKKEILKEESARKLEALKNKGIKDIYKVLAKEFHPDLELNPERRAEKELLMKKLTSAYDNRDLVTLLSLESEWFGYLDNDQDMLDDDNLKAYNLLLKEQVAGLELEIKMLPLHPKYLDINRFMNVYPNNPIKGIEEGLAECRDYMEEYSGRIQDLSRDNPIKFLKEMLQAMDMQSRVDKNLFNDADLLKYLQGF